MSASRTRGAGRRGSRRKRTRFAGFLVVFVLVVVSLITLYAIQDSKPKPLTAQELSPIGAALVHVPSSDVTGVDPSLPRPVGGVRSYWHRSGQLVTVIYSRKGGYDEVLAQLQREIPAAGWVPPAGKQPGRAPGQTKSWSYVYERTGQVAQVTVIAVGGVTATTYIVQTKQ